MAISLVAMATATFLNVLFELIEERIWFIYFSGSLVDSFCSLCLFFREIKIKALIENDDVINLRPHQIYDVTAWECHLITLRRFENCFIGN